MAACACGPAPAQQIGIDFSAADDATVRNGAGASIEDIEAPSGLGGFEPPATSPLCLAPFQACGGKLAGLWKAVETCNAETHNPRALQIWGQVMRLDMTACFDAVQSVTSEFMGEMNFKGGDRIDLRMRRDTIKMTLSVSCLNATYRVTIKPEKIASICATLTDDMMSCTPVGGACSCTARRENEINTAGTYAVLGKQVAIGPDQPLDFFDYCVSGNLLTWREANSPRHVVLQRVGEPGTEDDPELR